MTGSHRVEAEAWVTADQGCSLSLSLTLTAAVCVCVTNLVMFLIGKMFLLVFQYVRKLHSFTLIDRCMEWTDLKTVVGN